MTYKNCQTVGTVPKSIIKITERGTIDDPNTQIHDVHSPGLIQTLQ